MIAALRRTWDNFRGSGEAAVTVPPMDGALRPNQRLEEADLVATITAPDDLAHDGKSLIVSSGSSLFRLGKGKAEPLADLGGEITAVAASPDGRILAAVAGKGIIDVKTGAAIGQPLTCVTALATGSDRAIYAAQGSTKRPHTEWKRDLMERRMDGALWRISVSGEQSRIADNLGWPLGIALSTDRNIIVSESWQHRLIALREGSRPVPVLDDLPAYPARLHRDPAGGYWLAMFAPRNQIIEFVQREPAFLANMFAEIDPAYWVAPSLHPSATFLEPLQGGAQKHLGMLKPWAPTRSYGLVIKLNEAFRPVASWHSRADGQRHGVFTCLPTADGAIAASRGGNAVVNLGPTDAGAAR